ncbi:MAG: 4-hydroxyproline 2-epimerase [Phycisphaerae bacterium]|nr:MAG: 4-hydroxyproline 2-epimerase [Phycisphaerae bacterium]
MPAALTITVIDSHTAGEPTRVVIGGMPEELTRRAGGSVAQRREVFRARHDHLRAAIVNEPRGSEAMVGAMLCEPSDPAHAAGVIFFNTVGYLGMCGHGLIGLVATLAHLDRLSHGQVSVETPVGVVGASLAPDGRIRIDNVPSYRFRADVTVNVPGVGPVRGDVAWGGNWFFLVAEHGQSLELARVRELTDFCLRVRAALAAAGITGDNGAEIDHVELFGPPSGPHADSRNFVLCPGGAYDRSPCGTGTSAKLACLFADRKLAPGQVWRQESIVGTVFEGHFAVIESDPRGVIRPSIVGRAHVTARAELVLNDDDPFRWGIS